MKISEKWTYPADIDRVWAMTTDQAFQEQKCADSGAVSSSSSITASGDSTVIVNERDMPADDLPDVLKKLIGSTIHVTETQTWAPADGGGVRAAQLDVVLKGQPITMHGTVVARPEGEATTVALEADLKAAIPLLGGKLEKAAAPAILDGIRREQQTGNEYLAG